MGPHCGIGSSVLPDAKEKRGVITDTNKQGWDAASRQRALVYSMRFWVLGQACPKQQTNKHSDITTQATLISGL